VKTPQSAMRHAGTMRMQQNHAHIRRWQGRRHQALGALREMLDAISGLAGVPGALAGLLGSAIATIHRVRGHDYTAIWLLRDGGLRREVVHCTLCETDLDTPSAAEQEAVEQAATTRQLVFYIRHKRHAPGSPVPPEGWGTQLCVPVLLRGEPLAVLEVRSRSTRDRSVRDFALYWALAAQLAVALENARLVADLQATNQRLSHLLAQQQPLVQALASANDCIIIQDPLGIISVVNRATEQTFGYAADELRGRPAVLLWADLDADQHARITAAAQQLGGWRGELMGRRKDGHTFPAYLGMSAVRNEAGECIGLVGVARDLTVEKQQQAELVQALAEAAALKELDALRSQFFRIISHELRTPLAYLVGFSELLMQRAYSPDDVREMAQRMNEGALRLTRLVDDLALFTELQNGKITLNLAPVPLAAAIAEALDQLPSQSERARVHVGTINVPPVVADQSRLARILGALIDNALKFSPDGSPVEIIAHAQDGGVCIDIVDQGPGIPPDEYEDVFRPLYRGREAEARRTSGPGLGLAIVEKLVHLHGGRIEIESTPGHGTRMHVWLAAATQPR